MTTHHSFNRVFDRLKASGSWEQVACMPLRRLKSIIKDAGLSGQKAPRIKAILKQIVEDFGQATLDPLRGMSDEEATMYLTALPGVGTKTAKCVLMYSLNRQVLPVDTHGLRVAKRLGLIQPNVTLANVHQYLEPVVKSEDRYAFHVNVIDHGRRICLPLRPKCSSCPLNRTCNYARELRAATRVGPLESSSQATIKPFPKKTVSLS